MNRKYEIGEKVVLIKSQVVHLGVVCIHPGEIWLPIVTFISSTGTIYIEKGGGYTSKMRFCTWAEFVEQSDNELTIEELEKLYYLGFDDGLLYTKLLESRTKSQIDNISWDYVVTGKVFT